MLLEAEFGARSDAFALLMLRRFNLFVKLGLCHSKRFHWQLEQCDLLMWSFLKPEILVIIRMLVQ